MPPEMRPDWLDTGPLVELLVEARGLGLLGPAPVEDHIRHAQGFMAVGAGGEHGKVVDLGSGAGVPGLVLAWGWPTSQVMLLDANERKTAFLSRATARLGLGEPRVSVVRERAEVVGRQHQWRSAADLVVARSFGPPAVVAECAAPLLVAGGRLVVSEPPKPSRERWSEAGLDKLGLVATSAARHEGSAFRVLEQRDVCPERYPRRSGVPRKRPLF